MSILLMDIEIRKAINQRYEYLKAVQANRGDIESWDRFKLKRNRSDREVQITWRLLENNKPYLKER